MGVVRQPALVLDGEEGPAGRDSERTIRRDIEALQEAGFPLVLEDFSFLGSIRDVLPVAIEYGRGVFVGIR